MTSTLFTEQEYCIKRYGFWAPELMLDFDDRKGTIKMKANSLNYTIAAKHLFPELKYSVFERAVFNGDVRLTSDDVLIMRNKLIQMFGVQISRETAEEAFRVAALATPYNPLQEYYERLHTPTTTYLDTWLIDICGAADTEINRIIGRKFLIAAVARALEPGCYVEGSLILFGGQAVGKSRLIKNLNPIPRFYCASSVNIANNRDASQAYAGKHIVEFAELSQIVKKELEDVKRFLTEQVDTYIPKYSNLSENVPRMMIFAGSTNEPDILVDTTGNRRFWAVEVGEINLDKFLRIKEDLWAEAYQAYGCREDWTLTKSERVMLDVSNQAFQVSDPLTEFLSSALRLLPEYKSLEGIRLGIINDLIKSGYDAKTHPKAVSRSLRSLGYTLRQISRGPYKASSAYVSPEAKSLPKEDLFSPSWAN